MNSSLFEHLTRRGAVAVDTDLVHFGRPAEELSRGGDTLIVPLTHYGLLRVAGPDAAAFLHNLLTNDIKKLSSGQAQHSGLCSNKGRLLASFLVWREADAYLLRLSRDVTEAVRKKLGMYVLRSKVTIEDAGDAQVLIGVAGPRAEAALRDLWPTMPETDLSVVRGPEGTLIRLSAQRFELCVESSRAVALWDRLSAATAPAGTDAWRAIEIAEGVPLITARLQEAFVPQMANFELLGGVSFQKGCYPGQEIVARTQYLGRLKRRLYRAHVDAAERPAEATPLYAPDTPDQACGEVANVAPAAGGGFELLAVIQMASADGGEVHLGRADGPVLSFKPLPYAVG